MSSPAEQVQSPLNFFATAPLGVEDLLVTELEALGAVDCRPHRAGVDFSGSLETALRACLFSRIASRILLPLHRFDCADADALYTHARDVDWCSHLPPGLTFAVRCSVGPQTAGGLQHSHFAALRVKDAIVDSIRDARGQRPDVDAAAPDLRFDVYLAHGEAHISLDLAGDSLHRRGYRRPGTQAPLKENLAAAVLLRSRWPQAAADGLPLIDPMCGSGTLLIEAAWMAADVAPNLNRRQFGFSAWPHTDASLWQTIRREAEARAAAGLQRLAQAPARLSGTDIDPSMVRLARQHLARAGLDAHVQVTQGDALGARSGQGGPGVLVCNPPYGERLGAAAQMLPLYAQWGQALKAFGGWQAHILVSDIELGHALGLRATSKHRLYNGSLPCTLLHIPLHARTEPRPIPAAPQAGVPAEAPVAKATPTAASPMAQAAPAPLTAGAQMLANRLRKTARRLKAWRARHGISCYRLYDADLPEYAVAIDVYGPCVHVQEYAPPDTIDPVKRQQRLRDVLCALPHVLGELAPQNIFLKVRSRQRGNAQYTAQGSGGGFWQVQEGACQYWVNFTDYLDTGLFLDHRPMRQWLHQNSRGQAVLNLFGYTGSATVAAATGGAKQTTTVDMSRTYLDWAQANLNLNGLDTRRHELVQADCDVWLDRATQLYDIIFVDPPTFSNSKRMAESFDIQRDHVSLLQRARQRLHPGGRLIFSTNARRFTLDAAALAEATAVHAISEITPLTLPEDFAQRARPAHRAWLVAGPPLPRPFVH